MTKEVLQQAQNILAKIEQTQMRLHQMDTLLDEAKEDKVKTRIRGMDFELPKAAFRSEVNKKKGELQTQLTLLENEFDAL